MLFKSNCADNYFVKILVMPILNQSNEDAVSENFKFNKKILNVTDV